MMGLGNSLWIALPGGQVPDAFDAQIDRGKSRRAMFSLRGNLDRAKSRAENWTVKRHKALAEKDPQGAPEKFHIKEEVPDDLPAGEVPIAGVVKLRQDLERTLTDHFTFALLDKPFDFLILVHFF